MRESDGNTVSEDCRLYESERLYVCMQMQTRFEISNILGRCQNNPLSFSLAHSLLIQLVRESRLRPSIQMQFEENDASRFFHRTMLNGIFRLDIYLYSNDIFQQQH